MRIDKLLLAVPALVVIAAAIYLLSQAPAQTTANYSYFTIGNHSFAITYVALNYSQWTQGLMNKTVTNTTFELFVFPNPDIYPFWMNNTYYNLDMIWINGTPGGGKVVYIVRNATSCLKANCPLYTPNAIANYVIEAKAGFAAKNGVVIGSRAMFD